MKKFQIIKIIGLSAVLGLLIACSEEPPVEKEIVVVPVVTPAPTPAPVAAPTPEKPTSITVDKDGVKLEGGKVEVNVNK